MNWQRSHLLGELTEDGWGQLARPKAANEPEPATLNLLDWRASRYVGEPPPVEYLVQGTIPRGVPGLVASMGDLGKSNLLLKLASTAALGSSPLDPPIFGGRVVHEGSAVILTAEDGQESIHRRIAAIDPKGARFAEKGERLIVVPLPSAGGPIAFFREGRHGLEATDDWKHICDQLAAISDLALAVFDPLQAFAHAPINESPEAGQFVCSNFAALASDTGATVLIPHHMRKSSRPIVTLSDARDAIRGTTALVDGVRVAYALWPAEEAEARAVCRELREPFQFGKVAKGGVVKANEAAKRTIATYVRNEFGLLVDRSSMLLASAPRQDDQIEAVIGAVQAAAGCGQPFTKTGKNGVYEQRARLPEFLRALSRNRLEALVQEALDRNLIVQAMASGSTSVKWLDVPGGLFATGNGQFVHGAVKAIPSVPGNGGIPGKRESKIQ